MTGLQHVHLRGTGRSVALKEGVRVTAGRASDERLPDGWEP